MRSPAAQILETALALQRAPGERFRLRERALPPGIVHAIEIAAASPAAVQSAAAELGEEESTLVEAARFYLEQVLFADPNATAYRVLGLAPDATGEAIRTHHRWLQRWLHPDRAQAGDASVFATRVNQAFAQLRSPESRHAYDVRLAEARLAEAAATLSPDTVRHWEHEDTAPRYGRRSRWLLAAALAACVVLAVLIVRNPEHSAQWTPEDGSAAVAAQEDPGPAIEDRDLGVLGEALTMEAPTPAPASGPEPAAPASVEGAVVDAALPSPPQAQVAHAEPGPAAQEQGTLRSLMAAAMRPLRRASDPSVGVVSNVSTVAARPSPPAAAPAAARVSAPATSTPPTQQQQQPATVAAVAAAPKAIEAAPAAAATPLPAQPAPAAPAPANDVANDVANAAAATIRPEDAALVAARLPLAQERVAQLAGYLASQPRAVPLWDNVQAMAETNEARDRINARKGSRLEFGRPAWRMRPEQATLNTDYRCRKDDGTPCNGRLEVTLVWREGLWLVRGVSIGPAA